MKCLESVERDNAFFRCLRAVLRILRKDLLLTFIVTGVVIGFIIGLAVNGRVNEITDAEERKTTVMLIGFPGELFMNMIKMLILPLIVGSLVTAVASLDSKATAKIGRRTIIYYLGTTFIAVVLGIILVTSIKPGRDGKPQTENKKYTPKFRSVDSFLDLIRNMFPPNIAEASFNQRQTKYSSKKAKYREYNKTVENIKLNETSGIIHEFILNATHKVVTIKELVSRPYSKIPAGTSPVHGSSMNVLGLVLFSIVLGAVLSRMEEKGLPLKALFESLNEASMRMVKIVMWYSPIGICSLIAAKFAGMDDIARSLEALGLFMATSIIGVLIHSFMTLPLIYYLIMRENPYKFMAKMSDAFITAWGTASSAATLPTTIRCAEENLGIDPRITRFVLPLGATVNMDGTALYEAVGAIWIAQMNGISLGAGKIITTCLTATAAAVGAAAVPSAGIVTMVIVCQAINVPAEDIGLIFAVDWLIDRFRTTSNVIGDAFGSGIVAKLSADDLVGDNEAILDALENAQEKNLTESNPQDDETPI